MCIYGIVFACINDYSQCFYFTIEGYLNRTLDINAYYYREEEKAMHVTCTLHMLNKCVVQKHVLLQAYILLFIDNLFASLPYLIIYLHHQCTLGPPPLLVFHVDKALVSPRCHWDRLVYLLLCRALRLNAADTFSIQCTRHSSPDFLHFYIKMKVKIASFLF